MVYQGAKPRMQPGCTFRSVRLHRRRPDRPEGGPLDHAFEGASTLLKPGPFLLQAGGLLRRAPEARKAGAPPDDRGPSAAAGSCLAFRTASDGGGKTGQRPPALHSRTMGAVGFCPAVGSMRMSSCYVFLVTHRRSVGWGCPPRMFGFWAWYVFHGPRRRCIPLSQFPLYRYTNPFLHWCRGTAGPNPAPTVNFSMGWLDRKPPAPHTREAAL